VTVDATGASAGQDGTSADLLAMAVERTRSDLLDIAVHELRSPLTVIQGYASLLDAGDLGELGEGALKAVRVIAAKAHEAQEVATSLLTVARLESNELRIDREQIELASLLDAVRDRAGPRLDLGGGTLTLDCPAGARALGDAALVARILDNLVNNALIYSDAPAIVTLTVRHSPGAVEIRVEDRGPGVPEGDRERIFERFVRGAGAGRAAGTGLGLYVSRECARRMGGELALESSRPGQGSTFLLRLPAV
jgi:signal transduction histidine kinase